MKIADSRAVRNEDELRERKVKGREGRIGEGERRRNVNEYVKRREMT